MSPQLIKNRIIHLWNQKLKIRKLSFWNMIKNNYKAGIYERWLNSSPKILPRKFQIKPILNEPEQQRQLREKLALEKLKTEIELLKLRGQNNEQKYISIDEKIYTELKKYAEGECLENVNKLWKTSCEVEETNSLLRWEKQAKFFQTYEIHFHSGDTPINPFIKVKKKEINRSQNTISHNYNNRSKGNNSSRHSSSDFNSTKRRYDTFNYNNKPYQKLNDWNYRNSRLPQSPRNEHPNKSFFQKARTYTNRQYTSPTNTNILQPSGTQWNNSPMMDNHPQRPFHYSSQLNVVNRTTHPHYRYDNYQPRRTYSKNYYDSRDDIYPILQRRIPQHSKLTRRNTHPVHPHLTENNENIQPQFRKPNHFLDLTQRNRDVKWNFRNNLKSLTYPRNF